MCRPKTEDEIRREFLHKIGDLIDYWANNNRTPDAYGKLEGLAFSFLTLIDGEHEIGGYELRPVPSCEEDVEFHKREGENYYGEDSPDIGGALHEYFVNDEYMGRSK